MIIWIVIFPRLLTELLNFYEVKAGGMLFYSVGNNTCYRQRLFDLRNTAKQQFDVPRVRLRS